MVPTSGYKEVLSQEIIDEFDKLEFIKKIIMTDKDFYKSKNIIDLKDEEGKEWWDLYLSRFNFYNWFIN